MMDSIVDQFASSHYLNGLPPPMHARKVIIVAWHFPPSDEIGGKIVWRLAKYLAQAGCDVRVLTPPAGQSLHKDHDFAVEYPPGVRVIRTEMGQSMANAALQAWKRMRKPRHPGSPAHAAPGESVPPTAFRARLRRLRQVLLALFDPRDRWIAPGSMRLREMLAAEPADMVLSVAPASITHHVVMRARASLRGTPWLAWLHDPGAHFIENTDTGRALRGLERGVLRRLARKEKQAIERASWLLVTTQQLSDDYSHLMPGLRRPLVVPCGFDPDELPVFPARERAVDCLTIAHVGTIYGARTPRPVLESLARLKAAGSYSPGELRVQFIGRLENEEGKKLAGLIAELGLEDTVEMLPQVPHEQAMQAIHAADVGLVLAENQPTQIPAKVFEYIGLRRPMLALSDGATHALVSEAGVGIACNSAGLDQALIGLILKWRLDQLAGFEPALEAAAQRYHMASIARDLLQAVDAGITRTV